ncbi:GNAT family N-acetyltransferase [Lewinella sp. W8]|uniref:GNAT family N-acetyltransferase n=1 Tax=Lewinella sp. W8 TaxID=2528208 RepID=UPI001067EB00|nr:GNAT family N-acetyltransferase [Lewinella sp. W8]MTB51814.1 GNAT family N-acetyltransferase [Lewinella sp. W8]
MSRTVTFRPGKQEDAAVIAEIHCRSWQLHYRGDFTDDYLDREAPSERLLVWKDRLARDNPRMLLELALIDGEVVGFSCVFLDHHESFGHLLDNLHVRPGFYGEGIGKQLLLRSMSSVSKARGAKAPFYLWVLESNEQAIGFYDRLRGRRGITETHHFPGGNTVQAISYHWEAEQMER